MQSKKGEKQEQDSIEENNIEDFEDDEDEHHIVNENLQCRFYRKDFPEEGDLVIVISLLLIPLISYFSLDLNYQGS
jgi:hypothetical protein